MKRLLIIDAGHGGSDPGACAFGYLEKDLTLITAKRVAELLKDFSPVLTRNQDITLNPNIRTELIKNKYEFCLSIHYNACNGSARGIEAIHSIHGDTGKRLADEIVKELQKSNNIPIRRTFCKEGKSGDYYYMHRQTGSTTTVIVECLFLDNIADIHALNIELISQGIANGFKSFLKKYTKVEKGITDDKFLEMKPVLRRGDRGDYVKELQKLIGGLDIDGSFGPATELAVIKFQKENGLKIDGVVGPETWGCLLK